MHKLWKAYLPILCLTLVLAGSASVLAQSSAGYDLSWHVIGGGGGESASAGYRVQGTTGQSLAGPPIAGSTDFRAAGGFWAFQASTPTPTVTPPATPTATSTPVTTAVPTTMPTAMPTTMPTATPTTTPGPPHRSFLPSIIRQ